MNIADLKKHRAFANEAIDIGEAALTGNKTITAAAAKSVVKTATSALNAYGSLQKTALMVNQDDKGSLVRLPDLESRKAAGDKMLAEKNARSDLVHKLQVAAMLQKKEALQKGTSTFINNIVETGKAVTNVKIKNGENPFSAMRK